MNRSNTLMPATASRVELEQTVDALDTTYH